MKRCIFLVQLFKIFCRLFIPTAFFHFVFCCSVKLKNDIQPGKHSSETSKGFFYIAVVLANDAVAQSTKFGLQLHIK